MAQPFERASASGRALGASSGLGRSGGCGDRRSSVVAGERTIEYDGERLNTACPIRGLPAESVAVQQRPSSQHTRARSPDSWAVRAEVQDTPLRPSHALASRPVPSITDKAILSSRTRDLAVIAGVTTSTTTSQVLTSRSPALPRAMITTLIETSSWNVHSTVQLV